MAKILVVNIGSTSFKFKLFAMDHETILARGQVQRVGSDQSRAVFTFLNREPKKSLLDTTSGYDVCIRTMLEGLQESLVIRKKEDIRAVGFKTVLAGELEGAVILDQSILQKMEEYSPVAPAHNPPYIKAIRQFAKILPNTPLVGLFETVFHKDMPEYAYTYPAPLDWREKYGIRRYGYHGASHRFASQRAAEIIGRPLSKLKMITCHLGGSSSLTALAEGRSVENSMGFSPQTGLPMGNRCGDMDPFILPYLISKKDISFDEAFEELSSESGLLGISGLSQDVRDLEEAAQNGHQRAALALRVFCHSIRKYVGSFTAVLGGLDVLVFTGGIGENSPYIRNEVCKNFGFLGLRLNKKRNETVIGESVISSVTSKVKIIVVPANEEIIVAREVFKLLSQRADYGDC